MKFLFIFVIKAGFLALFLIWLFMISFSYVSLLINMPDTLCCFLRLFENSVTLDGIALLSFLYFLNQVQTQILQQALRKISAPRCTLFFVCLLSHYDSPKHRILTVYYVPGMAVGPSLQGLTHSVLRDPLMLVLLFFLILFTLLFIFGSAGSSLLPSSCGVWTSHCTGFSCCRS